MEGLEKVVANLVQKVERRFYGKYRGFVVKNTDPEGLGRLKVRVPSVLGNVVTGWAMPCVPYGGDANMGFLFIPEELKDGAGVWIEFEEGDLEFPIWVGTFWSKPEGKSELPKPNNADGSEQGSVQYPPTRKIIVCPFFVLIIFADGSEQGSVQYPPTRKIIKTKKGHTIQFEDADGDEMVTIVEAINGQVITMNQDGITITDGANGNNIILDSNGIKAEDKNGNVITMDSSSVMIKSDKIKIGEGIEKIVLGTTLNQLLSTWYNLIATHTHIGNLGAPTTPPTPPLVPPVLTSALSTKHVVE